MALDIFNAASSTSATSPTSPYTFSFTCGGSNSILILTLSFNESGITLGTVSYNGVSMTQVRTDTNSTARSAIYYLVNPAAGSNTVSVAWTSTATQLIVGAICLQNAAQSNQPDNNSTNQGTLSSTLTTSITAANPTTIISVVAESSSTAFTFSSGGRQLFNVNATFASMAVTIQQSSVTGSYSSTWTGTNISWVGSTVSINSLGGNALRINSLRPRIFGPGIAK